MRDRNPLFESALATPDRSLAASTWLAPKSLRCKAATTPERPGDVGSVRAATAEVRYAMRILDANPRLARWCILVGAAIVAAGCSAARRSEREAIELEPLEPLHIAVGSASWYGAEFAGRPTASGEIFDPRKLTAAHRTLPLGSVVRVTNTGNGRSLLVRINDRGPFTAGRILDCSEAAARALGFRRHGVADVAIDWPDSSPSAGSAEGDYWVQLGTFETAAAAQRLRARVAPIAGTVADSVAVHRRPDYLRVHAGPYPKRRNAEKALTRLQEAGFDGVVVLLDRRDPTPVP